MHTAKPRCGRVHDTPRCVDAQRFAPLCQTCVRSNGNAGTYHSGGKGAASTASRDSESVQCKKREIPTRCAAGAEGYHGLLKRLGIICISTGQRLQPTSSVRTCCSGHCRQTITERALPTVCLRSRVYTLLALVGLGPP